MSSASAGAAQSPVVEIEPAAWLRVLRRYMALVAVANLVWELAHLPLYTIWETGSTFELVFAAVHCTGGDILIALSSLVLALFLVGDPAWPARAYRPVAALTIAFGLAYTVFSEWLNIEIREAWAYRDLMPVIPVIDAGLSPLMQWIVIPLAAFWWARRPVVHAQMPPRGTVASRHG
jgi:hypothetical protein